MLCNIKEYRTPHVLHAMSRFFVVVTPALFAPYFNYVRRETGSEVFAAVFAIFIAFALISLMQIVSSLEDPFREAIDSVKVRQSCATIRAMLELNEDIVLAETVESFTEDEFFSLDDCC